MISPHFEQFAKENPSIRFVHIDIDEAREDMSNELSEIQAVPTFWIYKQGERVNKFTGGNLKALQESVALLAEVKTDEKESSAVTESEKKSEGTCKFKVSRFFTEMQFLF